MEDYKKSQLMAYIQGSRNMVDIRDIILPRVWVHFSTRYANEFRPSGKPGKDQAEWIFAVNKAFGSQMKVIRKELFDSIPSRFKGTRMYKELKEQI